jgi:hypothetical protein
MLGHFRPLSRPARTLSSWLVREARHGTDGQCSFLYSGCKVVPKLAGKRKLSAKGVFICKNTVAHWASVELGD